MISKLIKRIKETNAPICVGLDPMPELIPAHILNSNYEIYGKNLRGVAESFFEFNKKIIDACYDLIPAVKPQIAMYEQLGIEGLMVYEKTLRYCKEKGLLVIGDIKRGDIGSTSLAYARGHIGSVNIEGRVFKSFDTDMVTVNPYLGIDGIKPFIDVCNEEDKAIFVLLKTSNPSSKDFQDKVLSDGKLLYEEVADSIDAWGRESMDGDYSNVAAVVGATYPEISKKLRERLPHTYFLVPGYGAQGAGAQDLRHCFDKDGLGAVVNSSRGIIAAYKQEKYKSKFSEVQFDLAAREAVKDMIEDISSVL
jgi:orotidine 5'-phosphate decarboxylase